MGEKSGEMEEDKVHHKMLYPVQEEFDSLWS
jgi:hypothetical protein